MAEGMRDRCSNCGEWRSAHYDRSGQWIAQGCSSYVGVDDPEGENDPGAKVDSLDRRTRCANCGRDRTEHYDVQGAWAGEAIGCVEYFGVER